MHSIFQSALDNLALIAAPGRVLSHALPDSCLPYGLRLRLLSCFRDSCALIKNLSLCSLARSLLDASLNCAHSVITSKVCGFPPFAGFRWVF